MSLKFARQKGRHFLLSLFYKLDKLFPLSQKRKLKLYLDLEWIFERLAHEKSFLVFSEHPVRLESFSFLKKFLLPTQRVLDLGCGTGDVSYLVSNHTLAVVGIDHHESLTEAAKRKFSKSNLTFVATDAHVYLEQNSNKFDVLILSHILEHLEQPEKLLTDYKGFFDYIYIEVPDFERSHLNLYRKQLHTTLIYSDADHIWEFDREDLSALIQKTGLKIVEMEFRLGVQKYWCKTH